MYQDQGSKKPKGPRTPPCHGSKWKATHDPMAETSSHWVPSKNRRKHRTMVQWGERTHYQGRDSFPHPRSASIQNGSIFAHDFGSRIVRGNFLPLTARRTLVFDRRYKEIFGRNRWVRMFEEEDTVKKKGNEKTFYTNDGKGMSLSTNDNKGDVKGCNGSAIKRSIVLMKQKLCFRITAKLGNLKSQHCSQQERK